MIHMYAVTDRHGALSCRAMVPLTNASKLGEIHLFTVGEWAGHPDGAFEITHETFADMVAEFEEQRTPLMVDYDHSVPERGDTRAAGWIHGLEVRGNELWGTSVEWTPRASEMLRDGEYKFCSPWFVTDGAVDRRTGEKRGARLLNVALTNMPFFDGHRAITLSQTGSPRKASEAMDEMLMTFITQVAEVAGIDPAAAVKALAQMGDRIGGMLRTDLDGQEMKPKEEKAAPEEAEPEPEEKETAAAEEEPTNPEKKPDEKQMSLQLPADAVKLSEIEARAKQTDELMALRASVASLVARLDSRDQADAHAKAASDQAEREAFVASEVKAGRVFEHERADVLFVLCSDDGRARYDRMYGKRTGAGKAVPIGVKQAEPEPAIVTTDNGADLTADFTAGERVALQTMVAGMGYTRAAAIEKVRSRRAAAN